MGSHMHMQGEEHGSEHVMARITAGRRHRVCEGRKILQIKRLIYEVIKLHE